MYRVAKETGIAECNLCNIEKGRRPAPDWLLRKIAEIPEMGIKFEHLRLWKAADEYPELNNLLPLCVEALSRKEPA